MPLLSTAKEFVKGTLKLTQGVAAYKKDGTTPHDAYAYMRHFYCRTHGASNDVISLFVGAGGRHSSPEPAEGVLGNLGNSEIAQIKRELDENAYYRFPVRLPEAVCDRLTEFALKTPCRPIPHEEGLPERMLYDRANPRTVAYHFDEQALFDNPDVQDLAGDPSIIAVAAAYLNSKPMLDLAAMWWSTAYARAANSEAAQLFHFDMDRLRFLKFFIYLTDVTPANGPHVYVAKSHRRSGKPDNLWRDGRIPDEEIFPAYSKDDIVQVCGPRGSMFAGDTKAFHKGTAVQTGDRLVLELEYCNSLFGAPFNRIRLSPSAKPQLRQIAAGSPKFSLA